LGTMAVRQSTTERGGAMGARLRGVASSYLVRRVLKALFTVYMVTTLIFFLIRLLPGNPVEIYVNQQVAQFGVSYDEAVAQARTLFAIDTSKPLPLQYVDYLQRLARGDLGQSVTAPGVPVLSIIRTYLPWTIFSVGTGLLIAFTLGSALGMVMAYRRGSALDGVLTGISSLLHSVPNYTGFG
jgi:peptide/nickel transport system permease protein